ncbi:PQQ-binding-like beta-propeller repeat protein [Roseimaritima ulvae]|uniref:Quinoprotein ethanol dehydrogenase n=1 Tax=Roseimaritima ulvae TaxID=980254 RepID=A0A5B9QYM6_9BACT|nr:PQQ-binding-like beta-propeller repeat protein [Roseimaritima ulvae]QEG39053.1 Quinoprotein ethanol dehydrogenase precursor [Roseimaritima ulvae]
MHRRLLTVCLGIALAATTAHAADWPQWRGPDRTNRSTETNLYTNWSADGPPLVWMAEGLGGGYASVSVADGKIYTTGNFDDGQAVTAFDAANGKRLWKTAVTEEPPKHGYEGSRSTPTIDSDRLYVVSSDGRIVCLRRDDGSELWSRKFSDWEGKMMSGWGYSESPLVDGDRVICTPGGPVATIVALDKMTGKEIWASPIDDGAGYASIVISEAAGVRQYVQLLGNALVGVDAANGKLLWRYRRVANSTANIPTPIAVGNHIFTSTAYNTGSALLKLTADGSGGVQAKEVYWLGSKELQNKHGGMVLVGKHIYCGHGNGNGLPICVDITTGETAWGPERAPGKGESAITYADGHVIFRRENGTVLLVRATPEKFDVVREFMPAFQQGKSWAHPVVANGRLYLRENDKLMAYKL